MRLFQEILVNVLSKEEISVSFPKLKMDIAEIVESESYSALQKIKMLIEDETLSDFDCVEQIVSVFENMGSGGGSRHDF